MTLGGREKTGQLEATELFITTETAELAEKSCSPLALLALW
jgi:hypothetical protein